ncbi:MAG: DUF255 domain-containing protein [Phycisphaeraceae bacterium]|nr:MAG: DUF255 domain-containing protein [Phycisphaeraceae bacterium]
MDQRDAQKQRPANRLAGSSSPYLLQHAHNPVDWRPWGAEAIEEARARDMPIFLSVGYSSCYWCHVMERQVFENPEIGALMNERFINIKVDREQRPDVDEVYMLATQLLTRQGGWPNSVFLTPDLEPFYAGTYFGPEDQHGRPGFPRLIAVLHDAWTNRRSEVEQQGSAVADAIRQSLAGRLERIDPIPLQRAMVDHVVEALARSFDAEHGGFGLAPKFPQGFTYPFLLDVHARTGDATTLRMAAHSLTRIACGGIHDQIGGGFHRYATDARWRVPHFEKMLYNQSELLTSFAMAHRATGDELMRQAAEGILDFLAREMTGDAGQFFSALDAETDATEGKFYVWTEAQIHEALGEEDAALFLRTHGLEPPPNFPGHRHPEGGAVYLLDAPERLAASMGIEHTDLLARLERIRKTLLEARSQRERPFLDNKVIAAWNGMMIDACARAATLLESDRALAMAKQAATFVMESMMRGDGRLNRIWREGAAEVDAFHEDAVFVAQGLVSLHRATGDAKWLEAGVRLMEQAEDLFADPDGAGYFFAEPDDLLIARVKSMSDGATPSGNSGAAHVMLDLQEFTGDSRWLERADRLLNGFSGLMAASPEGLLHMIHAVERRLNIDGQGDGAKAVGKTVFAENKREPSGTDSAGSLSKVRAQGFVSQSAVRPGDTFAAALVLEIEEGWHLNANPPSAPFIVPTVMDVRTDGERAVERLDIKYPTGEPIEFEFMDGPLDVYHGRAVIIARLRAPADLSPDSDSPLRLRLLYNVQACDTGTCLTPEQGEMLIETPIAAQGQAIEAQHADIFGLRD